MFHSRPRLFITAIPAALVCFIPVPVAHAQTTPPAAPPVDPQKVLQQIADLGLLRALLPLKLTGEQIDKLLVPLKTVQGKGGERRKINENAVRALSPDVEKALSDALVSAVPVPAAVDAKITKAYAEADARTDAAMKDDVDTVFLVAHDVLTADQKNIAKTITEDKFLGGKKFSPKAKADAVETLALRIYIERVFLSERSLDVLTRLRASLPAAAAATTKP